MSKFIASEDMECTAFARWLETQPGVMKFAHIPNETPTSPIQATRLKRLGVKRGVPDYLLIIRNRHVWIEMKRTEGGRVSVEQQSWIDVLRMTGAEVYVCKGFYEARAVVLNLLDAAE